MKPYCMQASRAMDGTGPETAQGKMFLVSQVARDEIHSRVEYKHHSVGGICRNSSFIRARPFAVRTAQLDIPIR